MPMLDLPDPFASKEEASKPQTKEKNQGSGFARGLLVGSLLFIIVVLFVTQEMTKKNTVPTTKVPAATAPAK